MSRSSTSVNGAAATGAVIQVGQCGNQIGPHLFSLASSFPQGTGLVDPLGYCRALCIDTEDKVVNLSKLGPGAKCKYRDRNLVTGHFGRGSNWAMGYHMEEKYGVRGEESFMETCLDRIRLEAEKCDCFMWTMILHSLAGGTGSGVGSRITQEIRDMFPNRYILSTVVAPLSNGENPLQSYNSLLCSNILATFSDQIILLQNDDFASKFGAESAAPSKSPNLGFDAINKQFAHNLAGLIFPTVQPTDPNFCSPKYSQVSAGMEISELVRSTTPLPNLRFTRLDGAHREKCDSFDKLFHILGVNYKTTLNNTSASAICPYQTISCVAALRGNSCESSCASYPEAMKKLSSLRFVDWNPFPVDFWFNSSCLPGFTKSVSVCSNSSTVCKYLEDIWVKARVKFDNRAYLHWYQKFGCDEEEFGSAFEQISQVVQDYDAAVQ